MNHRKSKQREKIVQILRQTRVHPTADWIYETVRKEMPKVSLGTVYRNLNVLIEQGHVQKLSLEGTIDRFEAKITPHYHLICEKCGSVQDFDMPHPGDINMKAQAFCDFRINRHRIDFYGVCKQCQLNDNP
ncbi:MAG: transcriptional repressor [Chitinispirillaceae bacterium]|nr:transcriptional repressor [Chitinispirillaceae bacterium]